LIIKDTLSTQQKKTKKSIPSLPPKRRFTRPWFLAWDRHTIKIYWKIPLVYGAIGSSLYFYITNNKKYHRYRDAYKHRLAGEPDEFSYLDVSRLVSAQRFYQRNRDLSLLVTAGFYILNIVDANVDAHLMQFNVSDKLSFQPDLYQNDMNNRTNIGLSLNYKF